MTQFVAWLTAFGLKILSVFDTVVDAVKLQLVSFKGALVTLLITALVVDLIVTGKVGIITYILALS